MKKPEVKPTEEQRQTYERIMSFYDIAEEMIDVVEKGEVTRPEAQVKNLVALVAQVEESAEILTDLLVLVVETGETLHGKEKRKAEIALRKLLSAIEKFKMNFEKILH